MTEAAFTAPRRRVRDPESTHREVARLRRRSLVVAFWRGALPVAIGVVGVGLLGWAGVKTFADMQPNRQAIGDIRMTSPEFHGRDKDGLPYVVTATTAVRDPVHTERINLTNPHLVKQTKDRGETHATAQGGLMNETSHMLDLWGGVVMDDAQGNHFVSPTARVDTVNSTMEGHDGVQSSGPTGAASGQSYAIDNKTGHVVLNGGVHTRLTPHAAPK